ncbi:hypothetical protein [Undibacterium sp. TJN19]|uniref:hypothetical protein n=1 Tax=Undibacterium sp. TJN19 TaxID=3413055 RepID=UPI003BF0FEA5
MLIDDPTPQTDALEELLTGHKAPPAAMSAVRRVRELELEVALLRRALAAMPEDARQNPVWQEKLAHLLSRVVLFRIAVSDVTASYALVSSTAVASKMECDEMARPSAQDK